MGLGVDAQSDTGAQRLYERVGMRVHWSAVLFEKVLDGFTNGNPVKPGPQNGRQFSAPIKGPTTLKSIKDKV